MRKLYKPCGVFSLSSPRPLQRKVFFELLYFFCRRGLKNIRELTKETFCVRTDENGVEYVIQSSDELRKNSRGAANDPDQDGGIMQATGLPNCPVKSFKLYLSKLNPALNELFQRLKSAFSFNPNGDVWYDAQVIGKKFLEKFMKTISEDAGLSQTYTNHCIRATCITNLDNSGKEARHIMALTGHKSADSIRSYARTSIGQKRAMSKVLLDTSSMSGSGTVNTGLRNMAAKPSKIPRLRPVQQPSSLRQPHTKQASTDKHKDTDLDDFATLLPSRPLSNRDDAARPDPNLEMLRAAQRDDEAVRSLQEGISNWRVGEDSRSYLTSVLGNNGLFSNCTFNFGT